MCYFIIFILFSWDKIFYIFKKDGNNSNNYFIYKRHELCSKHNSNSCGCRYNISKENLNIYSDKYIRLYNECQKIVLHTI